jgi:hypothetical protein
MNRMLTWQLAVGCLLVLEVSCRCPPVSNEPTPRGTYGASTCTWQTDPHDPLKKVLVCRASDGSTFRVDTAGIGGP